MIKGKFIEECSNRFLCKVFIDDDIVECYVSSSSKLGKYINLKNKTVMLVENKGKNLRTDYTLQAVRTGGRWVLLNLNSINDLYWDMLIKNRKYGLSELQREKTVYDYKTDFFLEKEKLLIEVKGVLAEGTEAVYPLVSCGRAYKQLVAIKKLLKEGFEIEYGFVLMNPVIRHIILNPKEVKVRGLFNECIDAGMKTRFYIIKWYGGRCQLKEIYTGDVELT